MIPVLQALPFDKTGKSPNNRTKGEVHDLTPQFDMPYRIVVMEKGYFYTNDLYIMDNRGKVLQEDIDYQCLVMEPEIAKKQGMQACAVIVVTNPEVGGMLYVEAQMVGGLYCSLNSAILEMAANVLRSANRKVLWRNLKDKPSSYRANGHLHALWELFGFTEQTDIIHRMTTAVSKIAKKDFDALYAEFGIKFNAIKADMADIESRLTTHIADTNDPHDITATQVQLNLVINASIATQAQAQTASNAVMNAYATPLRAAQSVATNFTPALNAHVTDYNNPHQDTAAKLGTMTKVEMNTLANQYYNSGETVDATLSLGGTTYAAYYTSVRANLPAVNLTTGILPYQTYTPSAGNNTMMLVPTAGGVLGWRTIASIFEVYEKKGNQVIYAGTMAYTTSPSALAGIIGTNYPEETIAVYHSSASYKIGTGNGSHTTLVESIAMAVLKGGVWQSPGWR